MSDYISTRNLTGLLGDIRRNNNFIVTIEGITSAEAGNNLELIIQRAFLPSVSLNVLDLRHGNDAKKFAGVATWEGGQITILDVLNKDELDAVLAWFKQTYNWEEGVIGYAEDFQEQVGYKKTGFITEYAADGKFERQWSVEGLWISQLDLGELDASSGEMKQVSMTIQIDPSRSFAPVYTDQ